ncbi:NfeD family protein [Sphingomonas mesophila]|uniref:NfeD family protein n=1 Tax=Sphingomonas mesophila TaxID=2303576 RepID=UPI000E5886B7|nr:NfeD family protein [Sphingomonas mesophila]
MSDLDPGWLWAIGGLVLLIAEVVAPGFFLVFLGVAAIATGLFTLLFDLGVAPQLALFVIYTGLALMIGKRWYAEPGTAEQQIGLNDPAGRLVGRSAQVVDPIDEHGGRVRLGDGEWTARGGPAAAGSRVEILAVEGNCLIVGPSRAIAADRGTSDA